MKQPQQSKSPEQARLNNATHDLFKVMQIIAFESDCDNLKIQLAISSGKILSVQGIEHKVTIISEMREGFELDMYNTSDQIKEDMRRLSNYFLRAHLFSRKSSINEFKAKVFLGKIRTAIFAMIGTRNSEGILRANIINF